MGARHRGKPDRPPLTTLLAVVAVPLAGIGLIIYLGASHPSGILILLGAADGVMVIQAVHRLVLNLANHQLRSAEEVADRLGLIVQLIGALVVALAFIGQVRGWMHGMFRDVTLCVLILYLVGSPIYWIGGKRRLIAALRTRTASGEPESRAPASAASDLRKLPTVEDKNAAVMTIRGELRRPYQPAVIGDA